MYALCLAVRMIPPAILTECRAKAREAKFKAGPKSTAAAIVIVGIWLMLAALAAYLTSRTMDL